MRASHLLALVYAAAAAALALTEPARDPDLFWHLRSGEWMLDNGRLLDRDIFSFTRAGSPYSVGQWLGQMTLALAYRAAGWVGIEVVRAGLVGVAVLFVSRAVLRLQPHPLWASATIVPVILASRLAWGDRPQLFTLALFPVFLDVLLAVRRGGRARSLLVLPPLALLWANLHGAFPLGLALVGAFALEAALARDPGVVPQRGGRAAARPLALCLVACAVATQLNPQAVGALGWAAAYASSPGRQVVEERATDVLSPAGALFAGLVLAAIASALALGRDRIAERVGPPLLWLGLIAPMTLLGLAIQRQLPYAAMTLAPFVAAAVPAALARPTLAEPRVPRVAVAALAAALALALAVVAALAAPRAPDLARYPAGALAPLRDVRGNLLSEYDWGGFLILHAPDRPTFIDGRGAALFAPDVLADFERAVRVRPSYREVLERHSIAAVLLRPDRPLVAALREGGWRVLAEEGTAWVLLARP